MQEPENINTNLYEYTKKEPEVNILPSVQMSIKNIIAKEGFTFQKIYLKAVSTNGSNYLGDLYEIDIKGETKDGSKEIHIFLKQVIPGEAIKSIVDVSICYSHEVFFYTELTHIFNTLQENANIPQGERLKTAKSYESNLDAIILENLARKGFKTLYRMDVMPIKFAEQSITQLAKLHGLSFVLKHTKRDLFEEKIKTIKSSLHFDLHVWKPFVKKHFDISTIYFDSEIQNKIDKFLENKFIEKFPKYLTGITDSVKCMCHGDFRISNIMVKEDDIEDLEVVIIDYQFPFYGSPVEDILYFIYTGTDRNFRKSHMNNLKDLYHDELAKFLMYFELDINDVYPKKVYEKDFEESLDFGLMIALYVSTIIFTVEDEVPDFGKDSIDVMSFKVDPRHKERITEIVEEYLELEILN